MHDHWYALAHPFAGRPALVLDASAAGRPHWPRQRELVRAILTALSPTDRPDLFVLGCPVPLAADDFERADDSWFARNAGRGRVIGPVFEVLADRPEPPVGILSAGRIFDLPDWRDIPFADRAIYLRLGEEEADAGHIATHLRNPIVSVELVGERVLPFYWDHPAWRWQGGRLRADTGDVGPCRLGVLHPASAAPGLRATRADGRTCVRPLELGEPPTEEWFTLPAPEEGRVRHAIQHGHYPCPVCGGEHIAQQLQCEGEPTFPSLTGATFAVADLANWPARVRLHPSAALRLGPLALAVRTAPGLAEVWRGDAVAGAWLPSVQPFAGWQRLEGDIYALVL